MLLVSFLKEKIKRADFFFPKVCLTFNFVELNFQSYIKALGQTRQDIHHTTIANLTDRCNPALFSVPSNTFITKTQTMTKLWVHVIQILKDSYPVAG